MNLRSCRPLCRSAGSCIRAVGRRAVPDPGARLHSTPLGDEARPRGHHDPCYKRRIARPRSSPRSAIVDGTVTGVSKAPSASGAHPLPQRRQRGGAGRQARPRDPVASASAEALQLRCSVATDDAPGRTWISTRLSFPGGILKRTSPAPVFVSAAFGAALLLPEKVSALAKMLLACTIPKLDATSVWRALLLP